jgi:hypothetical protein
VASAPPHPACHEEARRIRDRALEVVHFMALILSDAPGLLDPIKFVFYGENRVFA